MRKSLLLTLMLLFCTAAFSQHVAVKTNVLLDGLLTPNLGFELTTGKQTSLAVNLLSCHKALKQDINAVAIQPEYRFWYSGVPMNRGYVGVIGLAGFYHGDFGKTRYDGYGGGAGVSFGYVMNLTNRFNLEFSTGFGAFYYHQKQAHEPELPDQAEPNRGYALIPLQAAVSLSYIIK